MLAGLLPGVHGLRRGMGRFEDCAFESGVFEATDDTEKTRDRDLELSRHAWEAFDPKAKAR